MIWKFRKKIGNLKTLGGWLAGWIGGWLDGWVAGWLVGNFDFNDNLLVRLDLDFILGLVNESYQVIGVNQKKQKLFRTIQTKKAQQNDLQNAKYQTDRKQTIYMNKFQK